MDPRFMPMLCGGSREEVPHGNHSEFAAEAKLDGWRCIVATSNGHGLRLYSGRNGSEHTGQLPYLEEALEEVLPTNTVVDGELISTVDHGQIASVMNAKAPHRPSKALPALQLVLFDVLFYESLDLRMDTLETRRLYLQQIPSKLPLVRKTVLLEPDEATLEMVLELGFEGLVLKHKRSKYINDRSQSWLKIKPSQSIDCQITNLPLDGKGEFAGLVGAIEFKLPNGETGRASGMTRAVREDMSTHPDKYLGRLVEIGYQYMTKEGRLRHPRFLRMRNDLEPVVKTKKISGPIGGPPKEVKTRMRNYGAMKDEKLLRCIEDLDDGAGEAYERCVSKGGDPAADLMEARKQALNRGLSLPR